MHELSVAQSLVDVVSAKLADEGRVRVTAVWVRVGPLGGVIPQALRSAFGAATSGTVLGGARLEIEETSLVVWCPACGVEKELPGVGRLRCPACGTRAPRVVRGAELEVISVEVVDADPFSPDGALVCGAAPSGPAAHG